MPRELCDSELVKYPDALQPPRGDRRGRVPIYEEVVVPLLPPDGTHLLAPKPAAPAAKAIAPAAALGPAFDISAAELAANGARENARVNAGGEVCAVCRGLPFIQSRGAGGCCESCHVRPHVGAALATHVCPHCRTQRNSVMPHVAANWDRLGCGQKCQPTEQGIREVAARAKALPQHGTPQQATAADADQPMDVAGAAGDGGGGAEVVEALDGLLAGVEATAGGAAAAEVVSYYSAAAREPNLVASYSSAPAAGAVRAALDSVVADVSTEEGGPAAMEVEAASAFSMVDARGYMERVKATCDDSIRGSFTELMRAFKAGDHSTEDVVERVKVPHDAHR